MATVFKFSTDQRESIRNISKQFDKDNPAQNRILIRDAFKIYREQNENPLIINDMLKLCIKFKIFSQYTMLWADIETISKAQGTHSIIYCLLLKCCINSTPIDTPKCIQTLQWMRDCSYTIKQSDLSQYYKDITKLISKGVADIATLHIIHSLIDDNNIYVQTSLINQYGKYPNGLSFALKIFHSIDQNQINSVSLNAMINAFIQNNQNEKALHLYNKYEHLHDDRSHVLAIKVCAHLRNLSVGSEIHQKHKHIQDVYFKTALMNFYGANGKSNESQRIFTKMIDANQINTVVVNAMMKAFLDNKHSQNALKLYKKYENYTNDRSHNMALKACINLNDMPKAKYIVSKIKHKDNNVQIKNTLIDLYGHCGNIKAAQSAYNSIPTHRRDIISKNALCTAYLKNNFASDALSIYDDDSDGLIKDDISHICAFKACIQTNNLQKGKDIHSQIISTHYHSVELRTTLIEFYAHFGHVSMMETIFHSIQNNKNSQCIGAMMKAYSLNECDEKALQIYGECVHLRNDIIHLLAIKACINCNDFERGKLIHLKIADECSGNVQIQNILIDFYGQFGDILSAEKIFRDMDVGRRDIYSFNSMMNAYFDCSEYSKCIALFNGMNDQAIPDAISYAIALKACVESTAYHIGFEIDERLKQSENRNIRRHVSVIINLIELYGKCGRLRDVENMLQQVKSTQFETLCNEIGIWNACIKAFGRSGELQKAKGIFDRMRRETELRADRKTFLLLLNTCNHCGDLDEAESIWFNKISDMDVKYDSHIVTTLVDCFVRGGKLSKAKDLILEFEEYTNSPYEAMWTSLMNGCKQFNDHNMAKQIFPEIKQRFSKHHQP